MSDLMFGYEDDGGESWHAVTTGSRDDAARTGAERRESCLDPGETFEIRTAEREDIPLSRLVPGFAASQLLDSVADERHDEGYDDDWPEVTTEQTDDLQRALVATFVDWVHKHGLTREHWKPREGTFQTHKFVLDEDGNAVPVAEVAA